MGTFVTYAGARSVTADHRRTVRVLAVVLPLSSGCGTGAYTDADAPNGSGSDSTAADPSDAGTDAAGGSRSDATGDGMTSGLHDTAAGTETTGTETTGTEPPADDPVYGAFLWPIDAWVSATDIYWGGDPHSGSADLSAPYWAPIGASRAGVVIETSPSANGSYRVIIDHGGGYTTGYAHIVEAPLVEVGDTVEANQTIAFNGRTGHAFRAGAHVHFTISRDGERLPIPDLDFGHWVARGQPIPGSYEELDAIELPQQPYEVRVTQALEIHAGPAQDEVEIGILDPGEIVTVTGSDVGYYRIAHEAAHGWIPHSGTEPVGSTLFGVEIVSESASVHAQPQASSPVVGQLEQGELTTVFEVSDDFYRILYDVPTTYEWIAAADAEHTPAFEARMRTTSTAIRTGPGLEYESVGNVAFFDVITVHETHAGWYRVEYEGESAWVAGWRTSGRI